MIGYQDVADVFPAVESHPRETVDAFVLAANEGLPDDRFKGNPSQADAGRVLWVVHNLTKPALDLKEPWVVARVRTPGPSAAGKAPDVWSSTPEGLALRKLVNY